MPASPYTRARHAYESGSPPATPWPEFLAFMLEHGAVIATPRAFIIARPCRVDAPPESFQIISALQSTAPPDCWHIFLAAGDLAALAAIARIHRMPWLSYFRRGGTIRRLKTDRLTRHHDQAKNSSAATPTATTPSGERVRT